MSPEAQAGTVQLSVLLSELRRDRAVVAQHAGELAELRADWPAVSFIEDTSATLSAS